MLPELTGQQFALVSNFLPFAIACMGAGAVFFFIGAGVNRRYRLAVVVSGLVCAIAAYHYMRIYDSYVNAYTLQQIGGVITYKATGAPFNDFYRYADWFITVPLLMVELIAVLGLARAEARPLLLKLIVATALMIGLGFPGEISTDVSTRWFWFALSMIPFIYTLYVLYVELGSALSRQPSQITGLIKLARNVVILTWSFYPIAYALKTIFGTSIDGVFVASAAGEVASQIGYSIADITAKVGYGMIIYFIAREKSELEGVDTALSVSGSKVSGTTPMTV